MRLAFPPLYAILSGDLGGDSPSGWAERLTGAGVEIIQYRGKRSSSREVFEISRELAKLSRRKPFRFIVNDRADIAAMTGAGGVHVGQQDLGVEEARRVCGADCWVGISTHTLEQVREAAATSADYIAVGPIFPTDTKEDHEPVVGMDFVRGARALTRKPLVAIGGITAERAEEVYRAGADSLAVSRDLLAAENTARRVGEYLEIAERIGAERVSAERIGRGRAGSVSEKGRG